MRILLKKYIIGKLTYNHLKRTASNNYIVLFPENNSYNAQMMDSILFYTQQSTTSLCVFCEGCCIEADDIRTTTISVRNMSSLMYYISLNRTIIGEFFETDTIIASLNGQYLGNEYRPFLHNGIFPMDYLVKTRILRINHSTNQNSQQSS